jgi:hypothetical protein
MRHLIAIALLACFAGCSTTTTQPPPASPPKTPNFAVGGYAVYNEWTLDSNNAEVAATQHKVTETIIALNQSVGGQNDVILALDSSWDAAGSLKSVDTVDYRVTSSQVWVYGYLSSIPKRFGVGDTVFQKHWNKLIDNAASGSWEIDTVDGSFMVTVFGTPRLVTAAARLDGLAASDSTRSIGGKSVVSVRSTVSGNMYVFSAVANDTAKIAGSYAFSRDPSALVASLFASSKFPTIGLYDTNFRFLPGVRRELTSWK